MVSAKDASGNRLFTSDDFLTANQIAAFFSRLAAKKTLQDDEELSDDDLEAAASEARIQELSNAALNELALRHPIRYDAYNLCEMAAKSKFNCQVSSDGHSHRSNQGTKSKGLNWWARHRKENYKKKQQQQKQKTEIV